MAIRTLGAVETTVRVSGGGAIHSLWARAATLAVCLLAFSGSAFGQSTIPCSTDDQCDDGKSCTVDACKFPDGVCQFSRNDALCDDGVSCTDDGCNPTSGSSNPTTGCVHPRNDANCDDGFSCTNDGCNPTAPNAESGTGCIYSRVDENCSSDDDPCTIDGCDPTSGSADASGCIYIPIDECCTSDEQCDDYNACTDDTCNRETNGCEFQPVLNCCKKDEDCKIDDLECTEEYCDTDENRCKRGLKDSGARVSADQKGSLLVFSKIEIKWDADGKLIQDTILDFSNDADADGVEIQAYFVNGDRQIEERYDMEGNVVEEFEPGWNTADCRFNLTKNQPHFWSAANGSSKCQQFTVLDVDGPGRLDPEASDGTRLLRGFVVMWAVKFHVPAHAGVSVAGQPDHGNDGYWEEIRWNHLKGDAVILNYRLGSAWEYNAWAYQARCGHTGEGLLDCVEYKKTGPPGCADSRVIPGRLDMDGYQYDSNFDELLLDFYASGSTGLSTTGVGVMVDTDLTLHSMDVDVRQDGDGPILTKAEFEIFNENESKFSGTRRCICCWDQTLLSNYVRTVAVPNHFLRSKLGTNKGYARIDGVASDECDYYDICGLEPRRTGDMTVAGGPSYDLSRDTALVGLAFKILSFSGAITNVEWAGGNLHGTGTQWSRIRLDVEQGSGEAREGAVAPTAEAPRSLPAKSIRSGLGR